MINQFTDLNLSSSVAAELRFRKKFPNSNYWKSIKIHSTFKNRYIWSHLPLRCILSYYRAHFPISEKCPMHPCLLFHSGEARVLSGAHISFHPVISQITLSYFETSKQTLAREIYGATGQATVPSKMGYFSAP